MDELIARQLMAETSAEEESRLEEWRRASAAHEALYQRRRRAWQLLEKAQRPVKRKPPSAKDLIARAGLYPLPVRHEAAAERPSRFSRFGRLSRRVASAALAAGITATVGLLLSRPDDEGQLRAVEFITGPDEINTARLADGTVVRLAPGSRLEFQGGSPRVRRVSFEGVGYFAIARDEKRPFIIHTEGGDAKVLGTRFELRTQDKEVRVLVVEGRVALEGVAGRTDVNANQMGRAGGNRPPTVVDVEDVSEFLGWVNGLFVFQQTPLSRVARELEEHYGVEIDILDGELAEREVTAWLQEQSFDAALTAVCGAVGASCTIGPNRASMRLPGRIQLPRNGWRDVLPRPEPPRRTDNVRDQASQVDIGRAPNGRRGPQLRPNDRLSL